MVLKNIVGYKSGSILTTMSNPNMPKNVDARPLFYCFSFVFFLSSLLFCLRAGLPLRHLGHDRAELNAHRWLAAGNKTGPQSRKSLVVCCLALFAVVLAFIFTPSGRGTCLKRGGAQRLWPLCC